MKIHTLIPLRATALGCLLAASVAGAGMAVAETTESRIGKLEFTSAYPTSATARKLYNELDFQRATQAYLWGLPAVGFHALHVAMQRDLGASDGQVVLFRDLKDKAGMLTPNITTVYAFSMWNLARQGPLVVEVPAGASAGGILDIWQRPMTDLGQTGPDKGQGGKYLIVPPGVERPKADGYIVVQSPTNQVWFATRGLAPDPKDAEVLLRQHKLYAWNDRANPPQTSFSPVGGKPWSSAQPRDFKYWEYLHQVLQGEPVDDRDRFFYAMLRPIGFDKDKPLQPTADQRKVLEQAAVVGDAMARTIAYDKRFENGTVYPGKHWEYANLVELNQDLPNYAQLDERASWFYEAIANSTGMQGRTVGFGQVYLEASKDKNGGWLDGSKSYRMRVPANAPVQQFWSVTLYDNQTRGPVITSQGAADLSSRKDLVKNPDGSVDLFFGPRKPPGANAANWIETTPGRGWFAYFRLYGPTEEYFKKSWQLNDIEPLR